ncbi:MAG: hypothetical protein E7602_07295 [Ruminococcaceae bacterium]|nr:hypothetical protein [Oscillospiraceae bacterium]
MLTVLPIQSKDEQKELCSLCGAEYDIESFCYRADDGDFIGICQFKFENGIGYIKNLSYAPNMDDTEAMIIMLRATMSFMHRCGLETSVLENDCMPENLRNMSGYIKNSDGIYSVDLKKFYGHCH